MRRLSPDSPGLFTDFMGLFLGAGATGERGDGLPQMVMGVMAVCRANYIFGGPNDPGDIVN